MSDDVFRGMHPKKKKISPLPKNKQNKEKKQNVSLFSLFPFLFSFLSFLSKFPHNEKLLPTFLSCSRFHLKRKTHLSSLRAQFRAHTSSRAEERHLLSVVLCSFNTTIKSVLREKRERRERVVCGYIVACIVLIGEKSTRR
jgi:hypothetical protein